MDPKFVNNISTCRMILFKKFSFPSMKSSLFIRDFLLGESSFFEKKVAKKLIKDRPGW